MLLKEDYEDCDGECRAELELRDSGDFFFFSKTRYELDDYCRCAET